MIYVEPFVRPPGARYLKASDETPFPDVAAIVEHLSRAPEWNVLEALLWIALREERRVAAEIRRWRDDRSWLFHLNRQIDWTKEVSDAFPQKPFPDEQLRAALCMEMSPRTANTTRTEVDAPYQLQIG